MLDRLLSFSGQEPAQEKVLREANICIQFCGMFKLIHPQVFHKESTMSQNKFWLIVQWHNLQKKMQPWGFAGPPARHQNFPFIRIAFWRHSDSLLEIHSIKRESVFMAFAMVYNSGNDVDFVIMLAFCPLIILRVRSIIKYTV